MSGASETDVPMVSFIMGVYCCKDAAALCASVESVIAQTFEDWEFLIVDDGSPDAGATYAAIEMAAALDQRVVPLRYGQNRGLAYALNYCLERVHGIYVARQDDDDLSEPGRLTTQITLMNENPELAIVGTNATLFDAEGTWGELARPEYPMAEDFLWNSPFNHPTVLMKTDALRSVGGYRVAPETVRGQDYDLFMRMYAAGYRGMNIQEKLYRYRSERGVSKYRPMARRVDEAKVRARGFKALGFGPKAFPYVAKPILLGLVPRSVYDVIQHRRMAS